MCAELVNNAPLPNVPILQPCSLSKIDFPPMGTRQKFNLFITLFLVVAGIGCKPPGVQALYKGEELLERGEPKDAVVHFKEAVKQLPKEWRAWNYLGMALHRAGDLAGADQAYRQAVEVAGERRRSPNDPSFVLYFNMGRLGLDRGQLVDSEKKLHTYASEKQSFYSLFWLAEAFRRNGHWSEAQVTLERAIKLKSNSPEAWNRMGIIQLKLNKPVEAIASFKNALEHKKDFSEAQLNLAIAYYRYTPESFPDREALALESFKAYIDLNSKPHPHVQIMTDQLQSRLNPEPEPLASETNLTASLPLRNTNTVPSSTTALGKTNLVVEIPPVSNPNAIAQTKAPKATAQVLPERTAPPINPNPSVEPPPKEVTPPHLASKVDDTPSIAHRPDAPKSFKVPELPGVARYRYLKPERPLPESVQDPKRLKAIFDQAFHQHRLQELDEAIAGYRKVLKENPAHQQAYVNIALAMQVQGEVKESLPVYEKALAINPLSKVTRHGFATALNRSEYYIDAAREFQKLLEVYRDYVPAHLGLAVIYSEHLKVPEQAEIHYRRILKLNPQHPEAANIRQWLFNNDQR